MEGHTKTIDFGGIIFDIRVQKWPNGWTMKIDIRDPLNLTRSDDDNLFASESDALAAGEMLGKQLVGEYLRSS